MSEVKVIDMSGWQDFNVPYSDFKSKYGIYAAILRITERNNKIDSMFDKHYKGCIQNGVPVHSIYKFSYSMNIDEIRNEANAVVEVLKKYPEFKGIIWLDLEWNQQLKLGKNTLMKFAKEFKSIVQKYGYGFGIYCSSGLLDSILDVNSVNYDLWLAAYPFDDTGEIINRLRPNRGQKGWQFSSHFRMNGQDYDMSVFDKDWIDKTMNSTNNNSSPAVAPKVVPEVTSKLSSTVSADDVINVMKGWLGMSRSAGTHKPIIDLYNSYTPRARRYKVTYADDYCDTTVSAVFIKLNAVDLIGGTECGVEEHVKLFQKKGIWIEDGTIVPKRGDIIVFNWDQNYQPNDSFSDHIGVVEYVDGNTIHTIEGNANGGKVTRRTFPVGHGQIRGFARPKYGESKSTIQATEEKSVVKEEKKETVIDPILKVLNTAIDEIGYLEKRSNSQLDDKTANAGSNNYTKYWRDVYPQYQAQPWCACFVSWCMMKSFGQEIAKKLLKHWPFVYCPTLAGMTSNYTPHRGDVILFYRNGEYCHTGIVESVNGDIVHTIEGNTSGASGIIDNGGGVCRKNYKINSLSSSTKYFRPDYSLVSGNTTSTSDTSTSSSSLLLKKCSTGSEVKLMQEMLIACGYSCGSAGADGIWGSSTDSAVLQFQKDFGLEQDKIYGPKSAKKLLDEYNKYPYKTVATKKAYIRAVPGPKEKNLETIQIGSEVTVLGKAYTTNGQPWYKAKGAKAEGYIYGGKIILK